MGDLTYGLALKGPLKKKKILQKKTEIHCVKSPNNDVSPSAEDKHDKFEIRET